MTFIHICAILMAEMEGGIIHTCSVLPEQNLRHDERAYLGGTCGQYIKAIPISTSKKILYGRLGGLTCLMYAGENTVEY